MIAKIDLYAFSNPTVRLYARDTTTEVGSGYTATLVSTGLIRRQIDFGSLVDGQYDMTCDYPIGVWAVEVIGGVATIYDSWSDVATAESFAVLPINDMSISDETMTYADLVYRLGARRGLSESPRELVQLRTAIADAYREMCNRHTWKHYERQIKIRTTASQVLTATYDHTGGAYERLLTLTSGTFPNDAEEGEFNYNNETYKIDKKLTSTTATVSSLRNPGADFTSKSITWHRSSYPMPFQIRQISEIIREGTGMKLANVSSSELSSFERRFRTPGTPSRYTVKASENLFGSSEIEMFPPPMEATNYSVSMSIRPKPLSIFEKSGSDGSGSSGSVLFNSASGAFDTRVIGSILRISPTSVKPKGRTQYDDSLPDYTFQTVIKNVVSSAQVEIADALPATVTTRGYTISDPIDINISIMLAYLEALSWEKFSHNHDVKQLDVAKKVAFDELRIGIQAENSVNWNVEWGQLAAWYQVGKLKDYAIYTA